MAAVLKQESFTLGDPGSVETVEEALREVTRLFVEADARRGRLERRRNELLAGVRDLRRRRARNELDAFLPPLRLISIERAEAEAEVVPTLRGCLSVLFGALNDVLRIWWGRHFMPWVSARRQGGKS